MDYKKAFYSKLEDCYLGVQVKTIKETKEASANKQIKGIKESNTNSAFANSQASSSDSSTKSGFTNLLHIKEQYFAHIKAHLQSRIKALIGNDTIESNDIYNKLYTFFDSYLNETGTPFFTDTPIYKNIYAKIYSNSKDTSLFYKTQNLYYVKSDTLYQSLILQNNAEKDSDARFSIFFDASEYKQNADNSKNKVIFKLDCIANGALNSVQNPTHPLVPSAEGGGTIELHSASKGEQEDNLSIPQITIKVTNQKDLFPDSFNVFKSNSNEFSDDFIKALSDNDLLPKKPTDSHIESLKKLFSSYKKQNEIDFFIHKNAKEFLQEQFDLWMFSYLYKDSAFQQWEEVSIKRLQNVKNLAYEIIDFIAAFEEELKAIWLKPKFAKNTQYVFSIDTILSNATNANALLASIFSDSHFESQVKEWKELNLVDEDFAISSLQESEATQTLQNDKYKFLPIDTKHLSKESRFALLSAFSDLESLLNGELIKSDNFQALNSIMPKYQGKIDLIYIDPPYNAPASEIIYKNNFKDSTWISMMQNRLAIAKDFLSKRGILTCAIDENEQENLGLLLSDIFRDYEKTCVSVEHNPKGIQGDNFSYSNEFAYFLIPNNTQIENEKIDLEYKELMKTGKESERNTAKNCFYPIYVKDSKIIGFGDVCADDFHPIKKIIDNGNFLEIYPLDSNNQERKWRYSRESIEKVKENLKAFKTKNSITIKLGKTEKSFKTMWYGSKYSATEYGSKILKSIIPSNEFDYPKSIHTVKDSIYLASKEDSTILDFFGGSGTTAHAVLELNKEGANRKFILVEMGEHFYNVIIPRIKKVAFSSEWKDGKLKDNKQVNPIAIAFRYYELESYEEALANCEYVLDENSIIDYRKSRKLIKELNKECDKPITLNMSGYRAEFDIFQTIANLMGWKIKRLFLDKTHPLTPSAKEREKENGPHTNKKADKKESIGVESCEYSNGEILNVQSIDIAKYPKLKSLIWWESNA